MSNRHLIISLLGIVMLLIPNQTIFAVDSYINGCDTRAMPIIDSTTPLDYTGGCVAAYRDCVARHIYDHMPCRLTAISYLLHTCEANDTACRNSALLYARLMFFRDIETVSQTRRSFFAEPTRTPAEVMRLPSLENLLEGLSQFQGRDYEAAQAVFARIDAHTYDEMQLVAFYRAVTYATMGKDTAALDAYTEAINKTTNDPLAHYGRAQLFLDMEQSLLAAYDANWLSTYAKAQDGVDSTVLLTLPVDGSLLDTAPFESWMYYPVLAYSYGSGGDVYSDLTLIAPRPIQVIRTQTPNTMILREFGGHLDCGNGCYDLALLILGEDGRYSGSHQNYRNMQLAQDGENFSGSATWAWCIDRCTTNSFVLTQLGAPDPRTELRGERCGVLSRLAIGKRAETAMPPGYNLYDAPEGSPTEEFAVGYWLATIVGGGTCIDDVMWWQVETESGEIGWTQENWGISYALNPIPDDAIYPSWSAMADS